MNRDVVCDDPRHSIAQPASSCVTTVLYCQNILIHNGIHHILSGTQFVILDRPIEAILEPPALCLIHADQTVDELTGKIESLKARWPSSRVVLLSDAMELTAYAQVMQSGLDGLCSTAMSREALITALELVLLGVTFVTPAFAFSLWNETSRPRQSRPSGSRVIGPEATAIAGRLSGRETQILSHLILGLSNKHIARELGVAEATVKVHIKGILRKLKAANRTQAAMWAQQHMNVEVDDTITAAE